MSKLYIYLIINKELTQDTNYRNSSDLDTEKEE